MKIQDLFEENIEANPTRRRGKSSGSWYAPVFKDENKESGLGRIRGAVKDWLEAIFKATPEDLATALEAVKNSPEYKKVIHNNIVRDVSTAKELKNGTLAFRGLFKDVNEVRGEFYRHDTMATYKVLANGKIQSTDDYDHARADRKVPKPILVAGNPAKSIEKTMRRSLDQLAKLVHGRVERNQKNIKKLMMSKAPK